MPKKADLQNGNVFNNLTIISKHSRITGNGKSFYLCKCACGNSKIVSRSCLVTSKVKSCGCFRREHASNQFKGLPGAASYSALIRRYKRGAIVRGISFELTIDQCMFLFKQNCYYCGEQPSPFNVYQTKDKNHFKLTYNSDAVKEAWVVANGIDRLNPAIGYTSDNSVSCCTQCNYAKLDYSEEEFIKHCYSVVKYQDSLKKKSA